MSKITKIDDIEIYKDALNLAQQIYKLARNEKLKREYSLIDQVKRASLSVAANIAEGYGRNTKRDFAQYLSIALGSVNEIVAYLDFIQLEFTIQTAGLKESYLILSRRIHSFRSYLTKSS